MSQVEGSTSTAPVSGAPGLRICLLDAPRLVGANGAQRPLERKDAALLALLAFDGPASREKLAALLWPDTAEGQARTNLRQRLFRLRRQAGEELVFDRGGLRLADHVGLDVAEAMAAEAGAVSGELLGSHDYSESESLQAWVDAARARWRESCNQRLARLASEHEAAGRIAAALPLAMLLVERDPLSEHGQRRVMRLHYLRGDRAAALAAFERCKRSLHLGLGTRPGAETLQLAALIEAGTPASRPAAAPPPVATLRPPRLIGRDSELALLQGARLALLSGEPGIGKSRLLAEAATAHARTTLFGARPGDAALPYALLARCVRGLAQRFGPPAPGWARDELARVVPEFGTAPATPFAALRLQHALAALLREHCGAGPLLLAIDDLHFADDATLELLLPLFAAAPQAGSAWLLAVRSNEMPARLAEWLDSDPADGLQQITLGPLGAAAVQALLDSLALPGLDAAALAPTLVRHTGGNPMFILETLIAMQGSGGSALPEQDLPAPARIGALIERRLGQLGSNALKLARVAALAGQDFSAGLAAAVLGQHPLDIADAWRELEAAQVIRDHAFVHDLIFEATLRSVPAEIARLMHRDIARALADRAAPPARLAEHWFEAGEWVQAGHAFGEAARAAFAASRRAEEAGFWDRAVQSHQRAGDRAAGFEARRASIDAVLAARPVHEALAMTGRLLEDAQTDAERLGALLVHATAMLMSNRPDEAQPAADEAARLARSLSRTDDEFEAARRQATALAQLRRAEEGMRLLEPFAATLGAHGSLRQRFDYRADLAYVAALANRRTAAVAAWEASAELAQALDDRHELVTVHTNLAGLLGQLGLPQRAHAHAERAFRLRAQDGDTDDVVGGASAMNLALCEAALGRFDSALAHYESARDKFRASGAAAWLAACENNHGVAWLMLGQTARAGQALTPTPASVPVTTRVRRLILEGRIARAQGGSALAKLELALELLAQRDDPYMRLLAELDRSRALDPAEAAEACRRCAGRAAALEHFAVSAKARVFEIEALLRGGDAAAAQSGAARLWPSLDECRPADLYWPEALWTLYRAFDAAGDQVAALAALQHAGDWIGRVALPHVPEPFHHGFLYRNAVNRDALARQRQLAQRDLHQS